MSGVRILGISFDVYLTSACLVEDGVIVAASPEERFTRQKQSKAFPLNAIEYCLDAAGCSLADVDYVAVGWNPAVHANVLNPRFSSSSRWRGEQLTSVANQLLAMQGDDRAHEVLQEITTSSTKIRTVFVDHHRAHAALHFLSPFDTAAILTCDGMGEQNTVTFNRGEKNSILEIGRVQYPHSLGMLYGAFTQFLGFRRDSDEWKVMALYSYNVGQENSFLDKVRQLVEFLPDGQFELDLNYFSHYLHDHGRWYSDRFIKEFGPPRQTDEPLSDRHYQIAHALQLVAEEGLSHLLAHLHAQTGEDRVVLSGGTFMNSVYNGKVTTLTPFREVFIPSCPDDSGVSIGAALHVYHEIHGGKHREVMTNNYWGPSFDDHEIEKTLKSYKIPFKKEDNVAAIAAQLIADGLIIGWFQGRMEFGQRALGNRSILADPRSAKMRDDLNASVKFREAFRPFAPAVLAERVDEYFEIDGCNLVRFMERVYPIRPEKRDAIPAVTHVDGSGRLQTVESDQNPLFHALISEFERLTSIPIVVNTSFNLNGQPVVCTPTDAIRTFFSCGLDALVIGSFVLQK
jgi:carbamoyltransferase